jgi:ABC-2 type transport system permease protein
MSAVGDGFRDTFRLIVKDKAVVTALIGAVVLYSFFYPTPYAHEVASRLPVAVVDLDQSAMSRNLLRKTLGVRALDVVAAERSVSTARLELEHGRTQGFMVIPADFQRDILRGGRGKVALFANGALLAHGGAVLAGFGDALAGFDQDAAIAQARFAGAPAVAPLQLVRRPLFNTREGYGSSIVPAVAVLIIQQTLLIGIGLLVGTLQARGGRLTLPPARLLGVMVALGVCGAGTLLYFVGFAFWFQDYPRAGNLPGLLSAAILFIAAVVCLGLFVGSFFRTRERSAQTISLLSLPMFFFANVSWPRPSSPLALAWLVKLLPSTPGITAMVKLNQMGARLSETSGELWNLGMLIALFGGLAVWRYRCRTVHSPLAPPA